MGFNSFGRSTERISCAIVRLKSRRNTIKTPHNIYRRSRTRRSNWWAEFFHFWVVVFSFSFSPRVSLVIISVREFAVFSEKKNRRIIGSGTLEIFFFFFFHIEFNIQSVNGYTVIGFAPSLRLLCDDKVSYSTEHYFFFRHIENNFLKNENLKPRKTIVLLVAIYFFFFS